MPRSLCVLLLATAAAAAVAPASSSTSAAEAPVERPLGNTTYISGADGDHFMFYYYPAAAAGDDDASAQAQAQGNQDRKAPGNATPVVLWLQGGPGCAATMGLFSEMGPAKMDDTGALNPRLTGWNLHGMDLLTVDSPAGSGYSYNSKGEGSGGSRSGALHATVDGAMQSLLVALKAVVTEWQPQLQGRPLVIAGESFAGRWVPSLAAAILRDVDAAKKQQPGNSAPNPALNLVGVATGSGWTAPVDQAQCVPTFAYHAGMLGPTQRDGYTVLVSEMAAAAGVGDWARAGAAWNNVTDGMFMDAGMPDPSDFRTYGFSSFAVFDAITKYMSSATVRAQLGVPAHVQFGDGSGICSSNVSDALQGDSIKSSAPDFSFLLGRGIPALVFNGNFDWTVPVCSVELLLNSTGMANGGWGSGFHAYASAPREVWSTGAMHTTVGYVQEGGGMKHVIVAGAGHMAVMDQPENTLEMMKTFVANATTVAFRRRRTKADTAR